MLATVTAEDTQDSGDYAEIFFEATTGKNTHHVQ